LVPPTSPPLRTLKPAGRRQIAIEGVAAVVDSMTDRRPVPVVAL
jgi:hypothetical protein